MYKYSYVLAVALTLFSGCGGGGSDTPLAPSGTQQSSLKMIAQNLQLAGFEGASDVVKLDEDTIAFTYFKNSDKHFVVYNNKEAKIISNIKSFIGDTVSNSSTNQITYTNGTTVNVQDYTRPSTNTNTSTKSSLQMIKETYGSNLKSFTFSSDNKSDAVVVVKASNRVNLYLYDTPRSATPRLVHTVMPPIGGDRWLNVYNVRSIGSGQITFTGISSAGEKKYTYHYLQHRYITTAPMANVSPKVIIQQRVGVTTHSVERYVESPGHQGAAVLISSRGGKTIYLYGIEDRSNPKREQVIFETDDDDIITDLKMLSGQRVQYTYYTKRTNLARKTIVYDYFHRNVISTTTSGGQTNNNQSSESYIRAKVAEGYNKAVEGFVYTSDNHSDAAVVISSLGGSGAKDLVLYDIPRNATPRQVFTVTPPNSQDEWVSITNLRRIGGGKFTFTGRSRGNNGYQTKNYTYYYLQHRYENTGGSSSNNQQSSTVVAKIKQANEFGDDRLISYTYSSGGGGILVIGQDFGGTYLYRYNATPVYFERGFYNTTLTHEVEVYSASAVSGGEFDIRTNKGTYRFNYFTGALRHL